MDRYRKIHELLSLLKGAPKGVPVQKVLETLECSRHTLYRCLETVRATTEARIVYDPRTRRYRLEEAGAIELPGFWFTPEEILALLTLIKLFADLPPSLLRNELEPLREKLERRLASEHMGARPLLDRVRVIPIDHRPVSAEVFHACAAALSQRRRLRLRYRSRSKEELAAREISPLHLVFYRDHWYLDAHCHSARGLRIFSLDRIEEIQLLDDPAIEVSEDNLAAHYATSYGIFAGPARKTAVLRFAPFRARWVAREIWHPRQKSRFQPDGSYELRLPYGDARELLLDILRYGPDVEVIAPKSLRQAVIGALKGTLARYDDL